MSTFCANIFKNLNNLKFHFCNITTFVKGLDILKTIQWHWYTQLNHSPT